MSLSLISMLADVPLKSKRVAISLAVFSTAFFTSTRLASQTVSKDGMDGSQSQGKQLQIAGARKGGCDNRVNGSREKRPFAALEHLWHCCACPNPGACALRVGSEGRSGRYGAGPRSQVCAGREQQHHPDRRCEICRAQDGDQGAALGGGNPQGLDRGGGWGGGLGRWCGLGAGARSSPMCGFGCPSPGSPCWATSIWSAAAPRRAWSTPVPSRFLTGSATFAAPSCPTLPWWATQAASSRTPRCRPTSAPTSSRASPRSCITPCPTAASSGRRAG